MSSLRNCIVKDCLESGSQGYFSLPKDEALATSWVEGVKGSFMLLNRNRKCVTICWRHFHRDHFKLGGKIYALQKGTVFRRAESIMNCHQN